jgi:hypothetical protein
MKTKRFDVIGGKEEGLPMFHFNISIALLSSLQFSHKTKFGIYFYITAI